jgi:hypothetical protein
MEHSCDRQHVHEFEDVAVVGIRERTNLAAHLQHEGAFARVALRPARRDFDYRRDYALALEKG